MSDSIAPRIAGHLLASAAVKQQAGENCSTAAARAAEIIADRLRGGGMLMLCGNGGSAADAQHIAAEFVAMLDHHRPRPGLAAIALTTDTSLLTAFANDVGFDGVFARQVEALGRPDSVLLGISTSGNSGNVIAAIEAGRQKGMVTIGLTGGSGGKLATIADIVITVPSDSTQHIQETHIALGHAITAEVEILLGW